ncbi:MAG: SDR family oxidoreductase [Terriglobus roseus]|nr:SDR family oxidoreductase [Terriglobus roseus]
MASNRLAGRTALITGSSSGIGRAVAIAFAAEGANVCCLDLYPNLRNAVDPATGKADSIHNRITSGEPTHELLARQHGDARVTFVKTDVTSARDWERAVQACVERFSRLDIVVNNAGISVESTHARPLRAHETSEADYDKTMAVNAKGVFLGCKYGAGQMLAQAAPEGGRGPRGWIVNTASVQGLLAYFGTPAYCAAKHAVVGLTRQVALDYARDRIHCNCVCPGFLQTAMTQNLQGDAGALSQIASQHPWGGGGIGDPEDVARAVVYLASDDLRWITGVALPVDGGFMCQ